MDKTYVDTVRLLLDALPIIFERRDFALKGGTAINLFLRDMPRLSVDIDLAYTDLEHSSREGALKAIKGELNIVAVALKKRLGVTATSSEDAQDAKLFVKKNAIQVKIEVNHVFRGAVYSPRNSTLMRQAQALFSRSVTVSMLDPDELYASKLVAALDRQHPRDWFDILLLLESGGITPRICRAFTVYVAGHNRPMHELLRPNWKDMTFAFQSSFAGMSNREVSLRELVDVQKKIINEMPSMLCAEEMRFLLSLKKCQPDWTSLGISHLDRLPALRWKLVNLEKLARSNPRKHSLMVRALEKILM